MCCLLLGSVSGAQGRIPAGPEQLLEINSGEHTAEHIQRTSSAADVEWHQSFLLVRPNPVTKSLDFCLSEPYAIQILS